MKFLFCLIFGHFNTGQTTCKTEPRTKQCVRLSRSRFCLKSDDATSKRFTNRVTRSVLEIRSPHFYARLSQARVIRKRLGFIFPSTNRVTRLVNR